MRRACSGPPRIRLVKLLLLALRGCRVGLLVFVCMFVLFMYVHVIVYVHVVMVTYLHVYVCVCMYACMCLCMNKEVSRPCMLRI